MKKLTATICILMLMAVSAAYCGEMRGLWVDAWNKGFKTPDQTTAMIEKAKDCGFNAIFVQVRKRGDAYYHSKTEPMARDVAKGYDPLADIISKAKAAHLQVHAWLVTHEVYHDSKFTKPLPGQVQVAHPEWLMKNTRGDTVLPGGKVYLDPGVPEARAYLVGVIKEIVDNYQVDGIHLDVVRYPGREFGYNDKSVARFNNEKGHTGVPDPDDEAWCAWRTDQINTFVREAGAAAHSRKKVAYSVAVFANLRDAREYRFQDWPSWVAQDMVDFVVPMVFSQEDQVYEATASAVVAAGKGKAVVIGQGGWRLATSKSLAQIDFAMTKGAKGIIVYDYAACCKPYKHEPVSLMDSLKSARFSKVEEAPSFAK